MLPFADHQDRIVGRTMSGSKQDRDSQLRDLVKRARTTRITFYIGAISAPLFLVVVIFNHTVGRPLFIHDWQAFLAVLLQYGTLITAGIAGLMFLSSALGTASTIIGSIPAKVRNAT